MVNERSNKVQEEMESLNSQIAEVVAVSAGNRDCCIIHVAAAAAASVSASESVSASVSVSVSVSV